MLAADLAPLALELAQWGVSDPADLRWLDPPPAPAYAQARDLLRRLGALDGGKITAWRQHGLARHASAPCPWSCAPRPWLARSPASLRRCWENAIS